MLLRYLVVSPCTSEESTCKNETRVNRIFWKRKEVEHKRLLLPVVGPQTDEACIRICEGSYVFAHNFFKKSKLNSIDFMQCANRSSNIHLYVNMHDSGGITLIYFSHESSHT